MPVYACPKPRPKALDTRDRRSDEAAEYRRNSAKVRELDGHHCRLCGRHWGLATHHDKARSLRRRSKDKHAVENLITVCEGPGSCHEKLTNKTMKLYPKTDRGMRGPVRVFEWSDDEGGMVETKKAA